jgi:hypothetical protein
MAIKIAGVTVIGDTRSLSSITSLDAQTINTIETAIAVGPNTMTDLQVAGITTFLSGPVFIGSGTSTGTAGQILQVAGVSSSAYIGGNLGLGNTNPSSKLTVVGDQLITGVSTAVTYNGQINHPTGVSTFNIITTSVGAAGTILINSNLYVVGNITAGGTSFIVNAQQLQISDKDIVLGFTTNTLGNDVSTDATANHGGISIASTVGSPLINIPLQAGINSNPSTYKQFMWIQAGNYTGLGTDSWISNYPISIGNTSRVLVNSRFTVGTGFTVFDSLLDATDIRARHISAYGISTVSSGLFVGTGNTTGTVGQIFQVVGVNSSVFIGGSVGIGSTIPATTLDIIGTGKFTGIVTAPVFNGNLNATGVSTFNPGATVLIGTATSTGTAAQVLQVAGVSSSAYIGGRTGIGNTNPGAQLHVSPAATSIAGLFSGSTSTDMVRITQSGTGNPLYVNNPNRAPLFVDNNGRVAIGTTAIVPGVQLTVLDGNASISNPAISAGIGTTSAPGGYSPLAAFVGFAGSTSEVIIQNTNNQVSSSADICLLSDTANWVTNYIDLGINGSTYNQSFWQVGGPNDGYLYTSDGSLSIGANWNNASSTKYINFFINGTGSLDANEIMRMTSNRRVGIGTTIPNGLFQVSAGTSSFYVSGTGLVGIASTQPVANLDVTGTARVSSGATFNGAVTLSNTLTQGNFAATFNQTTSNFTVGSQTTGSLILGGPQQSAVQTLGLSTVSHTVGISTGASGVGVTKTINIGTGGLSGSFAYITLGPSAGLGTVFINTNDPLGIGSATPTSILDVVGDAKLTGVVTATTFSGNYNSGSTGIATITTLTGTTLNYTGVGTVNFINGTGLRYTGVSTFTTAAGPVLIGGGTSTGTAGQVLQVTGVSSSVYIGGQLGVGVTNPGAPLQVNTNASNLTAIRAFSGATANNVSYALGRTTEEIFLGIAANTNDFITGSAAGDFTLKNNSGKLMLGASGSNALTIDTSNNVLINVASGTGTLNQALQVGSSGTVRGAYISGNVGIASTNPTSALFVVGEARFTGVITAPVFNGNINATGVSSFTAATGPVLIGGGTSTGVTQTVLQVVGVNSSVFIGGNLGIGSTNPAVKLLVSGNAIITGVTTVGTTTSGTVLNPTADIYSISMGQGALAGINTTTAGNIAIGYSALRFNTYGPAGGGYRNNAVGVYALQNNTTGYTNNVFGAYAGLGATTGGTGSSNSAFGDFALTSFSSGSSNSFFGSNAGYAVTSGSFNSGVGVNALTYLTSGGQNTAIGNNSLYSATTGNNNSAVGFAALYSVTTGNNNNGIGRDSLSGVSIGSSNNSLGNSALYNATGNYNVAIGESTGVNQTSGDFNLIIGSLQNVPNLSGSNQLVIGSGNTSWISGSSAYNVGIGSTIPTSKLWVEGTARVSGAATFDNTLTANSNVFFNTATGNISFASQTTGLVTIGGTLQTGTITLGQASTSQILNLATGASGVGTTKTINLGTGGLSGSFTNINIGPVAGVGTVAINSGTNLGVGHSSPTSKLDVVGDARVSGVITASSFNGNVNSTGISTFSTVLIGTATSTGTALQGLQVGSATSTIGAFISGNVGVGTTVTTTGVKLNVVGATAISGVNTTFSAITQNIVKILILSTQTTAGTATTLTSDGSNIPSATGNVHLIPANAAIAFKGTVVANVTGGGNTRAWEFKGLIKRGAAASSTVLVGTPAISDIAFDAGASGWAISVGADTNLGAIAINVTGQAATTIRWVCKMESTEVTY